MKYFVDSNNNYIGGSDGDALSNFEVNLPPIDARQKWNGKTYNPLNNKILAIERIVYLESKITKRALRGKKRGDKYLDKIELEIENIELNILGRK